jgi:tetratricopeptide (TPR) repeat protein
MRGSGARGSKLKFARSLPVLALLTMAAAAGQQNPQTPPANPAQQPAPAAQPDAGAQAPGAASADQANTQNKKVISDQAEYNTFVAAENLQDPTERAEAMESFAQKYPKSIVAGDALEEALSAWQAAGDSVKVLEIARQLISVDGGNVRALAIAVALDRVSAAQGDSSALDELCRYSTAGMRESAAWQKPAGVADADFAQLRKQMDMIFNGASGYCALEERDFSQARDWYARTVAMDPTNLQDMYQLAIADLELSPIDVNGFWYCARAIHLVTAGANAGSAGGMESYCKPKYIAYHGSADGWDAIVAAGANQTMLPPNFAAGVTSAPAPPSHPAPASPARPH